MSKVGIPLTEKELYISKSEKKEIRRRFDETLEEITTNFNRIFFPGYNPQKNYNSTKKYHNK